jgi:hypothetical protein
MVNKIFLVTFFFSIRNRKQYFYCCVLAVYCIGALSSCLMQNSPKGGAHTTLWVSQPSHLKSLSSQNISPLRWVCAHMTISSQCLYLQETSIYCNKNDSLCCLHCQVKDFYDIPSSSAREWPGFSVVSTKVKHRIEFSLSHSLSLFTTEYSSSTVACWLCIGALSFHLM